MMPAKLMVEESFAFLFTCIEVSGIKLDFKQIGEFSGLTVAAARMRYSRLRKAVESGDLHGAYIHQPQGASTQMLELANPKTRQSKLKPSDKLSKTGTTTTGSSIYSSKRKTPKRLKLDEKDESNDDKKEITTSSLRRSTRKRKADQISGNENQESFFIPDKSATQVDDDDTEDGYEQPEDSNEDEEMDGGRMAKTKRPPSKSVCTPRKTITFTNRNIGPLGSPVQNESTIATSKTNAEASIPRSSFFNPQNISTMNEDEELEEEEVEEQSSAQEKPGLSVRTIMKQYMNSSPVQYDRQVNSTEIAQEPQISTGDLRTTSIVYTGQNASNTPNNQYFTMLEQLPQSGQTSQEIRSDRLGTHSYRTQRDVNANRNYDQGHCSDNYSHSQPFPPKSPKDVRPRFPPSGSFSRRTRRTGVTGRNPNVEGYHARDSNARPVGSMPPALSIPTYQSGFIAERFAPIDRSHPSSVLDGFAIPSPKNPDSLYGNPAYPPALGKSHSPYLKSQHTNANISHAKQQQNIPPTLSSPLPSPSPRPAAHQLFFQPAAQSAAHSPTTPTPATKSVTSETTSAQDKYNIDVTVVQSIEVADKEIQPDQSVDMEIDTSQYTKEDMDVSNGLVGKSQIQLKENDVTQNVKEDIEAADILVAMSRNQSKHDGDEI